MKRTNSTIATEHPSWMTYVLLAAAIYNLAWGGWVGLRPMDLFDLTGIDRPLYPGIWQCVGMIVGVYGVGYAIAATDPYRHWPIVLVGFLGKTFGPIGMAYQWLVLAPGTPGRLPLQWGWVNVTNDLIWWLPFAVILYQSFKFWNAPAGSNEFESPSRLNELFRSQRDVTLAELSRQHPVLVVFLRHSGCTFCREALQDLREQRDQIEAKGTRIVLVHMGDDESNRSFFESYDLGDVDRISDPECRLYRAYQLDRGRVGQLFGLSVFWRGFKCAILNRHGVGKLGGDGFQMPGAFLVRNNEIVNAFRHPTAASRPDYCSVAEPTV
ncbi:AhpC/TSA family protein [Stieleria sp. ICT_E10.1]|uniref:peroxiredoxin-like family protein n=1 Tax=Stieleria sedimenti TaxID=2976331 RepID=UPI00217FD4D4|nr:peroxiredoxin-like family protein [Stieleria sedimenti]MCS7469245.1 AhpC/TSA family protein [Stieleria sedimenti]